MKPWFPFMLIDWLEEHLSGDEIIFEWGSGGSTKWFSERCKQIVSVEHDKLFYDDLRKKLPDNVEYLLRVPGARSFRRASNPKSNKSALLQRDFRDYVKSIDSYGFFDIIIIDGRARPSCISHAIPRLREGGIILLDNSQRFRYRRAINMLSDWEHIEFFGEGDLPFYWKSTIWVKNINNKREASQYRRIILSMAQIVCPFIGR